jgi:A/G-specific adenine glycosylase
MHIDFTKKLLAWNHDINKRSMPWKGESDPYKVWISEIILQQTRVEQGIAYYNKFISVYPSIVHLAKAPEKEVIKNWEGLGYYSRCRNLIATAKKIVNQYGGSFPATYSEIIQLPGIGPYTASAIASFAFGLPYAVVDGNVERVLARFFGISTPAGTASGKKIYSMLANQLLFKKDPGIFNQAIMDFGATICKPRQPLCQSCVQSKNCQAFKMKLTEQLPMKSKAPEKKSRWLYYFIIKAGKNKIWIRERTGNDIWKNLYEFILYENGKLIPQKRISKLLFLKEQFGIQGFQVEYISPEFNQILTHQSITSRFIHLNKPVHNLTGYQPVSLKKLSEYPFPKLITDYIRILPSQFSW